MSTQLSRNRTLPRQLKKSRLLANGTDSGILHLFSGIHVKMTPLFWALISELVSRNQRGHLEPSSGPETFCKTGSVVWKQELSDTLPLLLVVKGFHNTGGRGKTVHCGVNVVPWKLPTDLTCPTNLPPTCLSWLWRQKQGCRWTASKCSVLLCLSRKSAVGFLFVRMGPGSLAYRQLIRSRIYHLARNDYKLTLEPKLWSQWG